MIGLNLQSLVDAGVVPDLGKVSDQFKELQNEINAGDKAGKYKLDVVTQLLPVAAEARGLPGGLPVGHRGAEGVHGRLRVGVRRRRWRAASRSTTRRPVIGNVGFTAQLYKDAKGLALHRREHGHVDRPAVARLGAGVRGARACSKKQKIGIVASDGNAQALKAITATSCPR